VRRQAVPILACGKDERVAGTKARKQRAIGFRRRLINGRRADFARGDAGGDDENARLAAAPAS